MLLLLPASLSCLILSAHFLRAENPLGALMVLALPVIALTARRGWSLRLMQGVLSLAPLLWLSVAFRIYQERSAEGRPFVRAGLIFAAVGAFAAWSAYLLSKDRVRQRFDR